MRKILLILSLFLTGLSVGAPPVPEQEAGSIVEKWLNTAPLTGENLRLAFEINSIISPEVVMAQSRIESGNYLSRLCIERNNLFGMKYPRVRETTAIGSTDQGFAIYSSWYDSVKDMKLFQEWYQSRGWDLDLYSLFLQAIGYAEDTDYINKLLLCTT